MRRSNLLALILGVLTLTGAGQTCANDVTDKRLIVLGVDGMDPTMLEGLMKQGAMPNLSKLASSGGLRSLGTSIPPQSPVAWSNFITGMNPGGHGLFDFLALDRELLIPYLSSARVEKPDAEPLAIGRFRIPLAAEETVLLRDGQAFWEVLDAAGIPTTMFRVPANYPPVLTSQGRALSGMGTPDLRGSSGTFTYFTDDPDVKARKVSGGHIKRVSVRDHTVRLELDGPPNAFLEDSPAATVEVTVRVDPENPVALVEVGDERALLNVGEWSDWVPVGFDLVPLLVQVPGMVRFFLRQTSPHFSLYVSPVNIDPADPAQPIANPAEYAFELAEAAGPFYTQEMPEDTKALAAHVLTPHEFLQQSGLVLDERRRLLTHELKRFQKDNRGGFLFFYFSSVDQRNHMLARQMDPTHPFHDEDTPADLAGAMRNVYREIDDIVGWVLDEIDEGTALVVMSDHGFAPFRRQAHLNTWLEQHGYLTLKNPARREDYEWLQGIDWSKTRAFAIGLNSLYLNVRGRERFGVVDPTGREELARQIAAGLLTWEDPETGENVVTQPALREDAYSGPHVQEAPDIIVGYARGYRASWATTTGKIPASLIDDNDREWSGDHCMDSRAVPGVLLSNLALGAHDPNLRDLPVSILKYFGITAPQQMQGRAVF